MNTILYFQTDEKIIKIEVYDVSGRRLTSHVVSENKIDVSELNPGNYMLKVYTENEILNTKILKD